MAGSISVADATDLLLALRARPRRYPALGRRHRPGARVGRDLPDPAAGLRPTCGFATLGGVVVAGLLRLAGGYRLVATLLPALAAFVVGCRMFAAAEAGLLEGPLRTALASLAVLLPGALIVTAMSELAAGDMMAGSARLIFGMVQLMLFTLGLVAASQLLTSRRRSWPTSGSTSWAGGPRRSGLVLISVGITVMESPPLRLLPWIVAVLASR